MDFVEAVATLTSRPCVYALRAERKHLLPKRAGFRPEKHGIYWYLVTYIPAQGVREVHTIPFFAPADPEYPNGRDY